MMLSLTQEEIIAEAVKNIQPFMIKRMQTIKIESLMRTHGKRLRRNANLSKMVCFTKVFMFSYQ